VHVHLAGRRMRRQGEASAAGNDPHHPNVAAVAPVSARWSPIGALASMRIALIFNDEWTVAGSGIELLYEDLQYGTQPNFPRLCGHRVASVSRPAIAAPAFHISWQHSF
jgi:hypothetical protein